MKRLTKHINLLIACGVLGCLFMVSCIKDNYAVEAADDESVTVDLYFNTRNGDSSDGSTTNIESDEGIKTLRVIISSVEKGTEIIERNILCDYSNEPEDETHNASKQLIVIGLKEGVKNFYVIANEASLGLGDINFPQEGADITRSGNPVDIAVFNPQSAAYFPRMKSEIQEKGLPITGKKTNVRLKNKETTPLTIPIEHAVAKMTFKIKNASSSPLNFTGVKFGEFFPNGTFLFQQAADKEVPDGIGYMVFGNEQSAKIESGEESSYFTGYFFETPSSFPKESYTVKLDCEELELEQKQINFQGNINRIARNSQVDILATISRETGSLGLEASVNFWHDGGSSDVSYGGEFNCTFERMSDNVRTKKAYATVYNDVDRQITFSMDMQTPQGAMWTANLSNGSEFELYSKNKPVGTVSGIGGAGAVTFCVRPKQTYSTESVRETDLYITLTRLVEGGQSGEEQGEQVINQKAEHPGTTTRIRICQVSTEQWDQLKNQSQK